MRQTGRPRSNGQRYPSGKLKPEGRGLAAANRLKHAPLPVKALFDPQLASALGQLSPDFRNELSWQQVDAGKAVATIYGAYHRAVGIKARSAASPSYQRAYGKFHLNISAEAEAARVRRVKRRWETLQEIIDSLPVADRRRARDVIEDLCVDDHQPAAANLSSIRAMLTRIATKLKVAER